MRVARALIPLALAAIAPWLLPPALSAQRSPTAPPPAPEREFPVQLGFRVVPDTVTVGQPFRLTLKVLAPRGARFSLPAGPDTATGENGIRPVELRGPRAVAMSGDTAVAVYQLVAWDVGAQPLRLPEVVVTLDGVERRPPLAAAAVFVRSVLPADTTLHVPKPARAAIVIAPFNWWPWIAAAAAILLALLAWLIWRRMRNRPPARVDPYLRAQKEFTRIEQLGLVSAGRPADHLLAMVDVAREYLAARVPGVRRSNTTTELLVALASRPEMKVPTAPGAPATPGASAASALAPILQRADLAKFARGTVADDEANAGGLAARAAVEGVEAALRAGEVAPPALKSGARAA